MVRRANHPGLGIVGVISRKMPPLEGGVLVCKRSGRGEWLPFGHYRLVVILMLHLLVDAISIALTTAKTTVLSIRNPHPCEVDRVLVTAQSAVLSIIAALACPVVEFQPPPKERCSQSCNLILSQRLSF